MPDCYRMNQRTIFDFRMSTGAICRVRCRAYTEARHGATRRVRRIVGVASAAATASPTSMTWTVRWPTCRTATGAPSGATTNRITPSRASPIRPIRATTTDRRRGGATGATGRTTGAAASSSAKVFHLSTFSWPISEIVFHVCFRSTLRKGPKGCNLKKKLFERKISSLWITEIFLNDWASRKKCLIDQK